MEVHHHPDLQHKKKNFKEYFLEFLMIFLAVTMGFIAENVRENISDRQKEKEYISSLAEDLKTDKASFNKGIDGNNLLINGEDSVLNFLSADLHKQDTAELAMIYFFKYGINYLSVTITDRTISQLKNNGGMRLIKNKAVSDQVMLYYNSEKNLNDQADDVQSFVLANDKEANSIFNITANRPLFDSFMISNSIGISTPLDQVKTLLSRHGAALLTYDTKTIATFMADIDYQRGATMNYINMLHKQKGYAVNLIKLIETEYHLQKE